MHIASLLSGVAGGIDDEAISASYRTTFSGLLVLPPASATAGHVYSSMVVAKIPKIIRCHINFCSFSLID